MSDDNSEEKKHDATDQKREKAREEGQVARAPDAIKLVLMVVFFLVALLPGSALAHWVAQKLPWMIVHAGDISIAQALHVALLSISLLTACMLLLSMVGALSGFVPGGFSASPKAIAPKFNKLNPLEGIKKVFSVKRLTETLKSVIKFVLIGGTGLAAFVIWKPRVMALTHVAQPDWTIGLTAVVWIFGTCLIATMLLVAVDMPLQAFFHSRELRMTDKEVRDESKDTQVSPEVKNKQREAQARASQGQQMEDVPDASTIVVNPTQYAVAFRYRQSQDEAPIVLASGAGLLAQEIREIARRNAVPIVEAPPLARALYYHATPGKQIPTGLYRACAEVLAYVWRLHMWTSGQADVAPVPPKDSDLAVDKRLDPVGRREHAEGR